MGTNWHEKIFGSQHLVQAIVLGRYQGDSNAVGNGVAPAASSRVTPSKRSTWDDSDDFSVATRSTPLPSAPSTSSPTASTSGAAAQLDAGDVPATSSSTDVEMTPAPGAVPAFVAPPSAASSTSIHAPPIKRRR
jgi:hypothetical protein